MLIALKTFRRRHLKKCNPKIIFIIILLILIYIYSNLVSSRNHRTTKLCNLNTEDFEKRMHQFSYKVHTILDKLHVKHFLCYNTLWGQIKLSKMLPWQKNIEICVLNKGDIVLEDAFQAEYIDIVYKSKTGEYLLKSEQQVSSGLSTLILFRHDVNSGTCYRQGWIHKFIGSDQFPDYLINRTLPLKKFGAYELPVPLYDIEIQKYLYPNSWWKEVVPENC